MAKTNKIAAIILGAAAGLALVKFLSMPKEEREEFYDFLKDKTRVLLDNAEETVEKVEQYMDEFKDKGINVNFVEQTEQPDKIIVRTYERGVENETFSCGTGVTASALVCSHNDNGFNRVEVQTKGGELSVEYDKADDHYKNIWLNGPAVKVFEGTIEIPDSI